MIRLVLRLYLFVAMGTLARSAPTLSVESGRIVLTDAAARRVLTTSGSDRDASLSSDGRTVTFLRATKAKMISTGSGEAEATELWIVRPDGSGARCLVRAAAHGDPKRVLAGLQSPQFSPDGREIFFLSAAWATSGAIHRVDTSGTNEGFVCAGNSLAVIRGGKYRGNLVASQHRYFLGGGSYDWFWLLRSNGTDVGPIGEDPAMFLEQFGK